MTGSASIDCRSTPAAPPLARTRLKASHTIRLGISNGLALLTQILPLLVVHAVSLDDAAPSLQSHYRTFITTTGCSVPVPRIGTLALVGAAHSRGSLSIGTTGSHVSHQSLNQGHATCTPDAEWAVSRSRANSSRRTQQPPVLTSSMRFRRFIDGSLVLVSLIHTCRDLVPTFPRRSPQRHLTDAARGGLKPAPAGRLRGAHPHL